jgi:PAS domain S-box-containing protein
MEAVVSGQRQVFRLIARGAPLAEVLDTLARLVEQQSSGLLCSVLLLDQDRQTLHHGAAPSLPTAYNQAIDGAPIGPSAGSCGAAAFRGELVVVSDIATNPLWAEFRHLALPHGLRACWSSPICSTGGAVLGTFAMYYREPRSPSSAELALIERAAEIAGMAIERKRFEDERARLLVRERAARALVELERRRFLDLVQGLDAIVWEADAATFQFTFISRRAEDLLGYPVERWLSEPHFWADHILAEDRAWAVDYCLECTRALEDHQFEYRIQAADGRMVWLRDIVHVVADAQGRPALLRGIMVDLTERKRAEEERTRLYEAERAARAEAEAAIQARKALVASVTHDLKNPLTAIRGLAQLLEGRLARGEALEPAYVCERLATIEETAAGMTTLIDELLDANRLEAGRVLELRRRPTDLAALVRHAVEAYQQSAEGYRFRWTAPAEPVVGTWDADRLERVLANLLSNAIKYSPVGGEIAVEVGLEASTALLTVRDHGIGIPAPDLPHVFERFRRAENVAYRLPGAGLGLSGARAIVEQHGGTIAVESTEGLGSTFTVRLPLVPALVTT